MPISAILFDKDGTLFDFQLTWGAWASSMLGHFAQGDDALLRALASALDLDLSTRRFRPDSLAIAGTNAQISETIAGVLTGQSAEDVRRDIDRLSLSVVPVEVLPLDPFLSGLTEQGHVLGIATNDNEAVARINLEHCRISRHFDFVAGADSGYGGKPDPGMVMAFTRHTGIPEAETVMVGDSLHDLEAGRAGGLVTVGVLTGVASEADLAPLADHIVADIGHLPDLLRRI